MGVAHHHLQPLEKRTLLAAATVNFNDVRQTMDGFGSESAYTPTPTATAIQQAYSPTSGIGLTFLRGSINQDGSTHQLDMMQQAAAYSVKLIMSARAAPSEWIANYNTTDGGYLMPSHYQDYANLLADSLQDWAAKGAPVAAVDFTVEPDLATTSPYTYSVWTEQQFADVLPVVANTLRSRGITTKIMLPESFRWDFSLANQVMADPVLSQYVDVLAAHGYDQADYPYAPVTNAHDRPVWMTEYILNNSSQTATQNAVALASDIHEALTVANVSAYLHFWMSDGTANGSYLMTNWSPNKRFWAMGNYSKFVHPGWVRVGETDDGGLDITGFKDPASGKFAIVVDNTGTTNVTESFTLNGLSTSSVTQWITSSTQDLAQAASIVTSGGSFSATIAANSVVTYSGVSGTAPGLQAPGNLTVAPVYGSQTSQLSLNWSDNSSGETAYTVERSADGTNWSVLTSTLPANTTSYVDTASEGSTWFYQVKATNGPASSPYSATASGSTVLAAPTNVTATAISGGLSLTWTINSAASTGVTIQRSIDGLTWSSVATLSTRATSYTDTIPGYNPSQIYFYRIRNTLGSTRSGYAQYNTTPRTPTNFKAAVTTPTSAVFTWTNNAVGAFAAVIQNGNAGWQNIAPPNLAAGAGTFALSGLTENTAYSFRIAAVAGGAGSRFGENYGAWSAYTYASFTTPVAAPTNLSALAAGTGTAQLTWTDNSAVETAYTVERSTNGTNWTILTSTLAAGSTSYTDAAAPTGTVYYRVKATVSTISSAYVRTQLASAVPVIATSATVNGTTTNVSAVAPAGFGSGTLAYTWSLDGTPRADVTFSTNGASTSNNSVATFAAAGVYVFRVTITDSAGDSTTSSTSVTVNQTLTSIVVSDAAARASYGGPAAPTPAIVKSTWEQLTATGLDQFGAAVSTQPTFGWSAISGGGSVSPTGLYAAPASAATPFVRAASGSVSAQITLSVRNSAQLLAAYGFNEGNGWNLADTTGAAGVAAKLSGGATFVKGRAGDAIDFNGVDGSVWVGRSDSLDVRGQIGLAVWIKPRSLSGTQTIISRGYGRWPNQSGTFLRIANGQYQVGFYDGGYHSASFAVPAGDVGNWVHLVGTYDGQTWRLYRNGKLVATYANARGSTYVPKSWRIGSSDASPSPGDYFNGAIDSVRIYAQALSASDVVALYNQSIAVTSAATASPAAPAGNFANLSVAAVDPDTNDDRLFTYTWSTVSGPGVATFTANGTNASKNSTAIFSSPGTYTLGVTITDVAGLTTASSLSVTVQDATPVQVTAASFDYLTSRQVTLTFDHDVAGSLMSNALVVKNLTTGATLAPTNVQLVYMPDTGRFTLPATTTDGNYRAILAAGSVTAGASTLASDFSFDFFVLAGDANHDRSVDLTDFTILAANFNGASKTFGQGDFNYDGKVDLTDFTILAAAFNESLPSPADAVTLAAPTRVAVVTDAVRAVNVNDDRTTELDLIGLT